MRAIRKEPIDFMGRRYLVSLLSFALIAVSLASLVIQGLNFGLDFKGGVSLQLGFPPGNYQQAPADSVRQQLDEAGYRQATVVNFGSNTVVMVRLADDSDPLLGEKLLEVFRERIDPGIELLGMEYVGPSVGEELRELGGLAILLALMLVALYITFRFQSKFAAGALLALVHDVIITLGCFSLTRWEFDLSVLAAILAVIGYSINDTIVVFDRIREIFRMERTLTSDQAINLAISSTLDRTLATSFTTLLVLVSMALFGGEALFGFSMALIIGIAVGTYSSIFVASSLLLSLNVQRTDLLPPPDLPPTDDSQP